MSAFVILALALGVVAAVVVVVAVRELLRNIRKLSAQVQLTRDRLLPLTDELQAEVAVTSVEIDGLTRSVERIQAERAKRPKRKRSKRTR